jgi:hypothetical protein
MATAKVIFHRLTVGVPTSRNWSPDAGHSVSVIEFTLELGGKRFEGLLAEALQKQGSGEFEVSRPEGPMGVYGGPWNHEAFRDACERYCQSHVNSAASFEVPTDTSKEW